MKFLIHTCLAGMLSLVGGIAQAVPITFELSGVIDAVYDPHRYGDYIKVDDAYSASFTIDSTTPNQDLHNPNGGLYLPLYASITVGQVSFTGVQNDRQGLRVQADTSPAFISLWSQCSSLPDVGLLSLSASLTDWTGTALSSAAIPLPDTAPPLSAFQHVRFSAVDPLTKFDQFRGTVTSFEVVPEPATLSLVLVGLVVVRRRRRAFISS